MIQNRRATSLVLFVYLGLSTFMTMPLVAQLGTHIPTAEGSDLWVHEWTFWWIEQALLQLKNPFYTDLLFHPHGVSLTTHNIAWFNIGMWFPLQATFGNTIAYSLHFIVIFTLNAFCMYLLALRWLHSRSAGILAGIIYGFWPYTFTQGDHPNISTIMWLPPALYYLHRTHKMPAPRNFMLAGLFIALIGISRWQLLLVASVALGLFSLYLLLNNSRQDETKGSTSFRFSRAALRVSVPFLVAGVLMLPLGAPVIHAQFTQNFPEEVFVYEPWFSATLLSYFLPNSHLVLYKNWVDQLPPALQFHNQRVDFFGYSVLLLTLIGLFGYWRRAAFWLLVAAVYAVLALGPELRLSNSLVTNYSLPYRLVEEWPVIQIVRQPNRFNAFLGLPLGLIAGYGLLTLRHVCALRRSGSLLTLLLCALVLAEYWPHPYPTESTRVPEWYHQLAEVPEDFAVFGLPPSSRLADKYFMHYQIVHQKPMVEGHVSRPTSAAFHFMDQHEFLWHLRIHHEMKPELVAVTHQLRPLAAADVRYLVLQRPLLSESKEEQFVDWLTYEPHHRDSDVIVYRTKPHFGQDFQVNTWLTADFGLIRSGYKPNVLPQGEPLEVDARWGSRSAPNQDYAACLTLYGEGQSSVQRSCHSIGGEWPTSNWGEGEVARGKYSMRIAPLLDPGTYTLVLEVVPSEGTGGGAVEGQHELGAVAVIPRERSFAAPAPAHPSGIDFGGEVRLYGFDLRREENQLRLTLHWQALERMEKSYKVFVHVFDRSTGTIIAQNDTVPRQWTYPTTWWEEGEFVSDEVTFNLAAESTEGLKILIGLYEEESGDRLPATKASGERFPNDAALLIELE